MTVAPIDRRSSLARARMFAPRRQRRLRRRIRVVLFALFVVLQPVLWIAPRLRLWMVLLLLVDLTAFVFVDERRRLPGAGDGPARARNSGEGSGWRAS